MLQSPCLIFFIALNYQIDIVIRRELLLLHVLQCKYDDMEVSQLIEKFSELTCFCFKNNNVLVAYVRIRAQLHCCFVFSYL